MDKAKLPGWIAGHRNPVCTIVLILFSLIFLFTGYRLATGDNAYFAGQTLSQDYYRAKVLTASDVHLESTTYGDTEIVTPKMDLTVKLLDGFLTGETVEIRGQHIEQNSSASFYPYRAGDEIFVTFDFDENDDPVWFASDHVRDKSLFLLIGAFLLLLVLFGGRKGVNTVITLIFTTASVFLVMIPAIIKGVNIYLLTFIIASFIIVMTLGIVAGPSSKSLAAAAGCIGGVGVAGFLTVVMEYSMKISGLVDEDSMFVRLINPDHMIDLRGVIFGAIAIGALGAVMDVAMSIASSLDELLSYQPNLSAGELMRSGLNIGRDIIGTMANTLILAYVGSSLNVILLLMAYNHSLSAVLNREMVAVEVLQSVAGSIGILCAVPCTAAVTCALHKLRLRKRAAAGAKAK